MLPINFQNLPFHQTATGYVVNQTNTKMLLIFHKKLQKWLPAGGHINEGEMPHIAAQREVLEETGIVAEFSQIQILDQNSISLPNSFATFLQNTEYQYIFRIISTRKNLSEEIKELLKISILEEKYKIKL